MEEVLRKGGSSASLDPQRGAQVAEMLERRRVVVAKRAVASMEEPLRQKARALEAARCEGSGDEDDEPKSRKKGKMAPQADATTKHMLASSAAVRACKPVTQDVELARTLEQKLSEQVQKAHNMAHHFAQAKQS